MWWWLVVVGGGGRGRGGVKVWLLPLHQNERLIFSDDAIPRFGQVKKPRYHFVIISPLPSPPAPRPTFSPRSLGVWSRQWPRHRVCSSLSVSVCGKSNITETSFISCKQIALTDFVRGVMTCAGVYVCLFVQTLAYSHTPIPKKKHFFASINPSELKFLVRKSSAFQMESSLIRVQDWM